MHTAESENWIITVRQRREALPFAIGTVASLVAGGLIAAITSPLGWTYGAWAAAYLVLVGGVSQGALIVGRLALVPDQGQTPPRRMRPHFVLWNAATLLVIGGTLADLFVLVLLGSLGLLAVLIVFWPPRAPRSSNLRGWRLIYRIFIVFLALSTITGCVLALL